MTYWWLEEVVEIRDWENVVTLLCLWNYVGIDRCFK